MYSIGVVVPTLGSREEMLRDSLVSLRASEEVFVALVSPNRALGENLKGLQLIDLYVNDSGHGLSKAINDGIEALPEHLAFVTWLGDDDQVFTDGLLESKKFLENNPDTVATYGICDYVDEQGKIFWTNDFGQLAVPLLRFGPDKIPQPGSLIRRTSFHEIGMLDTNLQFAFDLDLFLKLSKMGKVRFLPLRVAKYRWHPSSLSSNFRNQSNSEARRVRVSHLPRWLVGLSFAWEAPQAFVAKILPNRLDGYSQFD